MRGNSGQQQLPEAVPVRGRLAVADPLTNGTNTGADESTDDAATIALANAADSERKPVDEPVRGA